MIRLILGLFFSTFLLTNANASEFAERKYLSVDLTQQGIATLTLEKDLRQANEVEYTIDGGVTWTSKEIDANQVTLSGYGTYEVIFYQSIEKMFRTKREELWRQLVYVPYLKPDNIGELAKQYLPLVVFYEGEEYFPMSLNDMLDFGANENEVLKFRHVAAPKGDDRAEVKMGNEIKTFMSFNGHSDMNINFGTFESTCTEREDGTCSLPITKLFLRDAKGSIDDAYVYYDAQVDEDNDLYLTYYYFYAFDPKNTNDVREPATAAHGFDRESVIIKLRYDEQEGS
jgi:hypothetical protein